MEEAERAKEAGFCRQTFQWMAGKLSGVQIVMEVNKDELKARLDPNPEVTKMLSHGAKPLTGFQRGV